MLLIRPSLLYCHSPDPVTTAPLTSVITTLLPEKPELTEATTTMLESVEEDIVVGRPPSVTVATPLLPPKSPVPVIVTTVLS